MIWPGINSITKISIVVCSSITEISIVVCSSRCDLPNEQLYIIKINEKENKIVKAIPLQ
jgi:hypothetical protein